MPFNSYTFFLFALFFFTLYYLLPHRFQNLLLLAASYIFFYAWNSHLLTLIIASTVVDYFVALRIHQTQDARRRKWLLIASVVFNLGALAFFKYFNFFIGSAETLINAMGGRAENWHLNIVLPVGISFYTFKTMSYTIDVYRGRQSPAKNLIDYAVFVAFFPQLSAGPIDRASNLLPRIMTKRQITIPLLQEGAWLITWGIFKKCVIADNLAAIVDKAFDSPAPVDGFSCLIAVYAFSFQIYADFAGYTDIARGLAKLMGIETMVNFNLPYVSKNPREFWQRWHISLSTWLRDYLYISLGGNRSGKAKGYRNLMITMLLGGLWHGAAWTFVIWGAYHGVLLSIHRWIAGRRAAAPEKEFISKLVGWFVTFNLVCFGWMIFRANSMHQVALFLRQIFTAMTITASSLNQLVYVAALALPLFGMEAWLKNRDNPASLPVWNYGVGAVVFTCLWLAIIVFTPANTAGFIYQQF